MPAAPEPKLALTRDRIVAEAISIADAEGIDAVSMRKLASQLGVGAMSLYRHVANRDEMVEAMVEVVCAEIVEPVPGPDWREEILVSSSSAS